MVISQIIDRIIEYIGNLVSWLSAVLVVVIVIDVIMRYLFNTSFAALFELEWHIFATLFMLGAAYGLKHDKHVRVDVFYSRFSDKGKAWVNFIGTAVFLIPFCVVIIKTSLPFVSDSFRISESSPDPGGLAYRFIIKSTIPIGASLLLLQGISLLLNSMSTLIGKKNS